MMPPVELRPTQDRGLVRSILTNPRCYRRMVNDAAPMLEDFEVAPETGCQYFVAERSGEVAGLFVLRKIEADVAEVHVCIVPAAWGTSAAIVRAFLAWAWQNTGYGKFVAPVPGYNRLALRLARSVGFRQSLQIPRQVSKHGKPHSLYLLGLYRPE